MKFTFISSAVGIALLSGSAVAKPKMGMYELDPLGSNTDGEPTVKFNNFPFAANFYIEASTERPTLKHTVYNMNGQPSGAPCSVGASIDATTSFEPVNYNNLYPNGDYPAHSSAVMLAVSVSLSQEVHDTIVNDDTTDVCLRSWYEANFGGTDQVANYLDIRIQATKTVEGSIASFTQSVTIAEKSSQSLSSNQELTLTVDIASKLCDDDGNDATVTTFESGEDFRVCLSAELLEGKAYTITGITSVTCKIGSVSRELIKDSTADGVTRVDGATFRSVVTPDYFSGDSRTLSCSGTVALEEGLPGWFVNLERDSLTRLELQNDGLTGTIPSEIGLMTSLTLLTLYNNGLTGTIPSEIGLMTSLTYLSLYNNELTGKIPSEIGLMTSLTYLNFHTNGLTGTIPSEIGLMTSLEYFSSYNNGLTGTIPSEIGLMTSLTLLSLRNNQLADEIPSEILSMSGVAIYTRRLEPKFSSMQEHETRSLQVDDIQTEGTFDISVELDVYNAEIDQAGGVGSSDLRSFSLVVAALWTVGALFF